MAKLCQFSEGHPKPTFSEKVQKRDQEKFFKYRPERSPRFNGQQHSGANVIILSIVSTYNAKTAKDFGAKSSSKTARMAKLCQFSQGHPKPAFSEKSAKGGPRKIFKKSPEK